MTRLLRVEFRRYFSRRLTKWTALAVLALVGLMLLGVQQDAYNSTPARSDQVAQEQVQQCQAAQQQARATDPTADFGCAGIAQQLQPAISSYAAAATDRSATLALLFGAAAFFVGAAFFAGEFSTGSMGTWLTFEPRRRRVYASKVAATAAGGLALTAVWMAVLLGGMYVILQINGVSTDITSPDGTDLAWTVTRVLIICAAAGAGGAVLGTLLRHTAAALGVMLGYAILVEIVLANLITTVIAEPQPWLIYSNFQAFVLNGWNYQFNPCAGSGGGSNSCPFVEHTITLGHSSIYFATLTTVTVLLAAWVFQRRDVT